MMPLFHLFLAGGMMITGSINTLTAKAADLSWGIDRNGNLVQFNHPFIQAAVMFIGEILCLLVFYILRYRAHRTGQKFDTGKPFNPAIFALPALCDMSATSLMNFGLLLTDASIFQMLRGSVIVFTSIMSVLFLKRKLRAYHWIGIVLVIGGTAIVGTQSVIPSCSGGGSGGGSNPVLGNILIIAAQVIVSIQMVVEEKFIAGYDVPALQVVGFEGCFGLLFTSILLGILYGVKVHPGTATLCPAGDSSCVPFEDTYDAFKMIGSSRAVAGALVGNIFSIAFFNYFGVSVTKHINAATRMVLDSLRTIIIWAFSLGIHWETFCGVQIAGFITLLAGTIIYNALIKIPGLEYEPPAGEGGSKTAPLIQDPDSDTAHLVDGAYVSVNGDGGAVPSAADAHLVSFDVTNTPTLRKQMMLKGK